MLVYALEVGGWNLDLSHRAPAARGAICVEKSRTFARIAVSELPATLPPVDAWSVPTTNDPNMNRVIVPPGFFRRPRRLLLSLAVGAMLSLPGRGEEDGPSESTPRISDPSNPSPPASSSLPGDFPGPRFSPRQYLARQIPFFFPPTPPQLGAALNTLGPPSGRYPAPAELAAFVHEPFYAPLSTRLAQQDLGPKSRLRVRLDAYRADKLALQGELRTRLDALQDADPFTRQRELAAFARAQTPRLAALELTADQLRADLINSGFFDDSTDWNDLRRWQLGVSGFRTPAEAILAQYQVMRAAVFYQKGLSTAQRRLLREIAMELEEVAGRALENGDATPAPALSADTNPLFFFSPETARLRLPVELSPELARKISDYEKDKSDLKAELRETVVAQDSARFDFLRARALAKLAEKQQPRIDALEAMADDIRRELALLPKLARPPAPPPLPPSITARMTALLHEKRAAQKSALVLVQQIRKIISVSRVDATKGTDGRAKLSIMISPQDRTEAKVKPVRNLVARYNDENLARITALEKETEAIRHDVAQFIGNGPDTDDPEKAVRVLMDESYNTLERREEWALYKDYRAAVLEPGLSPEQRRLLYDGSLETLDLPLPGADRPVTNLR